MSDRIRYNIKEGDVYQNDRYTIRVNYRCDNHIKYEWCFTGSGNWKDDKVYNGNSCFINDPSLQYVKVEEKVRVYLDDSLFEVE